ncbi:MAG: SOS response-associated peptidase [Bacillaceae bacterium]|nr:SOS response-associated peptidase [Bacillaceae bacterium]
MCGRFTMFATAEELIDAFQITNSFSVDERYNIAPSQEILAIIQDGIERRAGKLKWGLIPPWAKEPSIGNKMINARGETLHEKPSFKKAFQSKRCIIPCTGFYEWQKTEEGKKPMLIQVKDEKVFGLAGLWEKWIHPESNQPVFSCTVVTTEPNELMADIHNRMPVILHKSDESSWLNSQEDIKTVKSLIKAFPAGQMYFSEVSTAVNSPKTDDRTCIQSISS